MDGRKRRKGRFCLSKRTTKGRRMMGKRKTDCSRRIRQGIIKRLDGDGEGERVRGKESKIC